MQTRTITLALLATALLAPTTAQVCAAGYASPQLRYTVHLPGVRVRFDGRYPIRHGIGTGTVALLYHASVPSAPHVQPGYTVSIGSPDMVTTRAINGLAFASMAHPSYDTSLRVSHDHGAWTVVFTAHKYKQCASARGGYVGRTVLEVYANALGEPAATCGPLTALRDRVYRALVVQARGQ
jgi:hypothetical protein